MMRRCAVWLLVLFGSVAPAAAQTEAINAIVGSVIPMGESPWPWYDQAHVGNADSIIPAALAAKPTLGPKAAGPFRLEDTHPISVTGPGVREFSQGDWAMVKWNATDGRFSGHFGCHNVIIAGDRMTCYDRWGLLPGLVAGDVEVYHCGVGCRDDTDTYKAGAWGLNASWGSQSWNYYDNGLSLYRLYLRTKDPKYLAWFREFTDTWWTWALDQMSTGYDLRAMSLVSQFVRALDGKPERFQPIYDHAKLGFDFNIWPVTPPHWDAREAGYKLLYIAVGARADPDPTRHASYCQMVKALVPQWITTQRAEGYWDEKLYQYAYRPPGTAPWRMFAPVQALARSYDVLIDPTAAGCHDAALAAQLLPVTLKAVDFTYEVGYREDTRSEFYDVQYPNAGQEGTNEGTKPGTVSIAIGSSLVTGTGTTFRATFCTAPGRQWIAPLHEDGNSWTYAVKRCIDDTQLEIDGRWGDQGEKTNAVSRVYYRTTDAPTNCGQSKATTCWPERGDRNLNVETIWGNAWAYRVTKNPIYKTRGDELMSATFGGPANGPGDRYPAAPGPCGGPGCDGYEADFMEAIVACAVKNVVPCNPRTNYAAGNPYVFTGKRWGQGSGIGGVDNYLAWRLDTTSDPCATAPLVIDKDRINWPRFQTGGRSTSGTWPTPSDSRLVEAGFKWNPLRFVAVDADGCRAEIVR